MQTSSALLLSMLNLLVNESSSRSWSNDSCTNIKLLLPMCHWVPLKRGVADRKLLLCSEIFSPILSYVSSLLLYLFAIIYQSEHERWIPGETKMAICVVTIIQKLDFDCSWLLLQLFIPPLQLILIRPVGRVDAASDGAMCWELLEAGRQFSRVLGTSWSCEGELGTSWLLKGRLYFQKCCHHLLLVFQAEENTCNLFETIHLLEIVYVYFIM